MSDEYLSLKWGTLKSWNCVSEKSLDILRKYMSGGSSFSAMDQRDTPEQKQAICDLIDAIDGPIHNEWTGDMMTKDEAKAYVLGYGT
ncbi:MAG: hypothetical protein RL492_1770 [Verrucomicrobiota bacterium]|jgi:hypothetical protein